MRKYFSNCIFLIAFILIGVEGHSSTQSIQKVLLINSYHNGYYWTDGITDGIKASIVKNPNIVLNIEYLDSKKFPDFYRDITCFNYFTAKYLPSDIDLIVTSDNDALDFVLLHKEEPRFKGKKIVSCGISNILDYQHYSDLYLVKEITTFEETFDIMVLFFPKIEKIYFITDDLKTGQIYIDNVKEIIEEKYHDIDLQLINCIDIETLASEIKKIKFPSVIFYSSVNTDCNNQPVNEYEIAEIIRKNAVTPLFSGYYASETEGYIGGCLTTGFQNGTLAAKIAIELLQDQTKEPNKITIPESIKIFDYRTLQKYKIPDSIIPLGSLVLHKPETFWSKHKKILIISGIIIFNLLIVIILLYKAHWTQKRYEKKLITAMEKAKESDKMKSIFLENVSHEMRTPLNSIVGFSDVLFEITPQGEQKKYLQIILDNALSLTHMINHVFDFSLLKSHRNELEVSTFKLSSMIDKIVDEKGLKKIFGEKPIKLTTDFDIENLDVEMTTDKEKLFLVIRHIINNAFKFTSMGEVYIKYRFSEHKFDFSSIDTNSKKIEFVMFQIQDTGKGIEAKDLNVIFEPFRQIDDSNTNANRGLGLGLSISKSIIEILGGEIWVESIPSEGTSVFFTIPIKVNKKN